MSTVTHRIRATDSARINLRTSPETKALIERAAALMGTTVSAFMLQNAYAAARQVVADNEMLILSQAAFNAFIAALRKLVQVDEV